MIGWVNDLIHEFLQPTISWAFEGQTKEELTNLVKTTTGLKINNVSSSNQGSYICNVENSQGSIQKVYYVAVKGSSISYGIRKIIL